jgi:hypothetical protein
MKTSEFEAKFDAGEDITSELDLKQAVRKGLTQQRINLEIPAWMLDKLDTEAARLGVTRDNIIKLWLAEKIDAESYSHNI